VLSPLSPINSTILRFSHSLTPKLVPSNATRDGTSDIGSNLRQFGDHSVEPPQDESSFSPLPASLVLGLRIAKARDTALVDSRRPPKADSEACLKFRFASRRTKQVAETEPGET
jgi:hypothetical protein